MSSTSLDSQRQLFGHPVGLYVLFFTEMWERFSYYGMRALLVLYMTGSVAAENAGLGWDSGYALAIYGWYTMLVYVASVPGGILADKYIGQKRSVMVGGILLVAGHGILAIDAIWAFYTGLALIILGVGALKPNISTLVGGLYDKGDERRDQGFTIFYIGINVGAFLSSLIVGAIGQTIGWHYGFGLAGIGMLLGQVIYVWGQKYLPSHVGAAPKAVAETTDEESTSLGKLFVNLMKSPLQLILSLALAGGGIALAVTYSEGWQITAYSLLAAFLGITTGLLMMIYRDINSIDKDRFIVLIISFLIVIVFWGAFEQAGGLMNIYTDTKIDRSVSLLIIDILFLLTAGLLGAQGVRLLMKKKDTAWIFLPSAALVLGAYLWLRFGSSYLTDPFEIPASVFQSVNAAFIIMFGTAVGGFWIWMKHTGKESSSLFKMALGTIIMGVGFLFMAKASLDIEQNGDKAALILLILAYLFHTIGELCASPVALSFITKLAPVKYVSIMMGVYFAATGLGNKVAGGIGEASQAEPVKMELSESINIAQLSKYTEDDSTLIKGEAFEIVGDVSMDGETLVLTGEEGENILDLIALNAENKKILIEQLEAYEPDEPGPLTAILRFDNETQPDLDAGESVNPGDYEGKVEVFEIQDNRELKTFLGIFIFTSVFGLLLLLFLKRLKKLTHGAETMTIKTES